MRLNHFSAHSQRVSVEKFDGEMNSGFKILVCKRRLDQSRQVTVADAAGALEYESSARLAIECLLI